LGAHRVIDYRSEDFTRAKDAYDIIFDTVGKIPFAKCKGSSGNLREIRDRVGKGRRRPVIDRVYPLAAIREAHAYTDTGRKRGNVVIAVGHVE
jgi:NADPH:quinone reductase-like Zn-dependent oxidoreductase